MATPRLPSTGSIVDYLKSQGQDSSFSSRRKMFNDLGFNSRLGDFTGSASQNTALLRELQKSASSSSTSANKTSSTANQPIKFDMSATSPGTPTFDFLNSANLGVKTTTPAFAPKLAEQFNFQGGNVSSPSAPQTPSTGLPSGGSIVDFLASQGQDSSFTAREKLARDFGITNYQGTAQQNTDLLRQLSGQAGSVGTSETPPQSQQQTVSNLQNQGVDVEPTASPQDIDGTVKTTVGMSASDIFPNIFDTDQPSEADLVNSWLTSAEGQLFLERQALNNTTLQASAEAAKQELERKYKSEKESLENRLASSGLAFSGIRATQVKDLADSLAASELKVDREMASKLLDADLDLREAILDGVAGLIKAAADDKDDAIKQLNAIGYAVIGNQLVPTLASQREERALRAEERAVTSQEISLRRLELAEQAAARAEAKFLQTYGEDAANSFNLIKELSELNPEATRQDLINEVRSDPQRYGNPSSTEINAAIDAVGIPLTQQGEVAKALVGNNIDLPGFSRLAPGNQSEKALKAAKEEAKKVLTSAGGMIKIGNKIYNLSTQQINSLSAMIDTVTLDEAKEIAEQD